MPYSLCIEEWTYVSLKPRGKLLRCGRVLLLHNEPANIQTIPGTQQVYFVDAHSRGKTYDVFPLGTSVLFQLCCHLHVIAALYSVLTYWCIVFFP